MGNTDSGGRGEKARQRKAEKNRILSGAGKRVKKTKEGGGNNMKCGAWGTSAPITRECEKEKEEEEEEEEEEGSTPQMHRAQREMKKPRHCVSPLTRATPSCTPYEHALEKYVTAIQKS